MQKNDTAESFNELFYAAEREKGVENAKSQRKESQWKNVSIALQGLPQKELAPVHSVKNGILENACSTSPRMDADLRKSALMRIARLMNSLAKGPKRMVTKVQWKC